MGRRTIALLVAAVLAPALLVACEPNYVDPVFDVDRTDAIPYATVLDEHGQLEVLHLDLYEPHDDDRDTRPVLVWAHGGSFTSGDRSSMRWIPEAFAARGFVVASIDYRLDEANPVTFPPDTADLITIIKAKEDMQAAVRFLRGAAGTYRLRTDRMSVGGYSAGAVMAVMVATTGDQPGSSGNPGQPSRVCAAVSVSGAGSNLLATPDDAGVLFLHGDKDTTVPYSAAVATNQALVAAGVPTRFVTFAGTAHGVPAEHPDELVAEGAAWLKEQMVDREAACAPS
ncbi:MAG: alpha/beta hydrolase [Actinobacteria bacterium]|nr:alpha/beta hydrolase [Actinomycetota bacterium]